MGECPFCKGNVAEDILVYGGRCPQCLIEIPGEEAPTDPGEEVRAEQAAAAATAEKRRGWLVGGIGGLALMLAGGGVGAWLLLQEPAPDTTDVYMDDSDDFNFAPASAHQDLPLAEEAKPEVSTPKPSRRVSGTKTRSSTKAETVDRASVSSGSPATTDAPPEGVPSYAPSGNSPPVAADPLGAFRMASGPASKGPQAIVLEKPGEIYEMVKQVMQVNGNQLKQCYEQRLKVNSRLRGAWTASFDIQESGRTAGVTVTGEGVSDAELESCMTQKIQKWTFQRIAEATRIDKTFRFGR